MRLNQNNSFNSLCIVNKNDKVYHLENIEDLNCLYPNGHRITHQMRWFKGSLGRGLASETAV